MSSFSTDCFRSVLKALEYPVFSHIVERKKTRRALNEMKNMGFIFVRTQITTDYVLCSPQRSLRPQRDYFVTHSLAAWVFG